MVELTQSVTQQKEEKKAMQAQLESQLQSWIDKYEKMEKRVRQLEQDLQNSKAAEEALQHSHESLQQDYNTLLAKSGEHEKENSRLNAEITKLREQQQQQPPLRVSTTPTNGRTTSSSSAQRVEEDANITELKSQIAALKAQLKNNMNGPRRQPSFNNLGNRNLSPAAQQMSPTANGRRAVSPDRMNNNGRVRSSSRRSSRAEQQGTVNYANREQMQPMSIDHSDTLRELDVGNNPEEAVCIMTQDMLNDVTKLYLIIDASHFVE